MLLALLPLILQDPVALPAPLACLVDQDDYPHVSRHLVVLEPGAESPRTVATDLLHSFDATDLQRVDWLGDCLLVNGPQMESRPSPNVAMPLHRIALDGDAPRLAAFGDAHPAYFAVSPDGQVVLEWSLTSVRWRSADGSSSESVFPAEENPLGRSQIRAALWTAAGDAVLVSVRGLKDGTTDGIWRAEVVRDKEDKVTGLNAPKRVGDAQGLPRACLPDGSILCTQRVERGRYTPHSVFLSFPGTERGAVVLATDLNWCQAAEFRPTLLGEASRPAVIRELAYVRVDGALVLRDTQSEAEARVLWTGPHPVTDFEWSPDGAWIAFTARDEDREPHVYVLHIDSGETRDLGPGLRPAWGPLSS